MNDYIVKILFGFVNLDTGYSGLDEWVHRFTKEYVTQAKSEDEAKKKAVMQAMEDMEDCTSFSFSVRKINRIGA